MYCKAPFVALTVNYDSTVRPCPHFSQKARTDLTGNLSEIWNSTSLEDLRSHYLSNNEPHPGCQRCVESDRLEVLSRRKTYEKFDIKVEPQWLDLRLSNLCNLKCRTCGSDFSSKWIADNTHLDSELFMKGEDHFYPPSFELLEKALTSELQILEIKGGEPLLALTSFLNKRRIEPKVPHLKITTNGTCLTPQLIEFLGKFETVEIKLSVDYIAAAYKPMRGYDIATIEQFIASAHSLSNLQLSIQTVISAYNLLELPSIVDAVAEWKKRYNSDQILPLSLDNFLVIPPYLSPHVHSPETLKKIISKFTHLLNTSEKYLTLLPTINFLKKADPNTHVRLYPLFINFTRTLDKVRSESFFDTLKHQVDLL